MHLSISYKSNSFTAIPKIPRLL